MDVKATISSPVTVAREGECLFCVLLSNRSRPFLVENDLFFAIEDRYPVNECHSLVVPKRHVLTFSDLTPDEAAALVVTIGALQQLIRANKPALGFNLGINEGRAAGQTVDHLHIHVIPRYEGDVDDPRGGIRNIKRPLVEYP